MSVGFNRRYSSFVIRALKLLEGSQDPRQIIITANAEQFLNTGPKIQKLVVVVIGEACHFLDLAQYLAQSQVKVILFRALEQIESEGA